MTSTLKSKSILFCSTLLLAPSLWAQSFEFDRPGQALGTAIVPKGQLAWEQGLPSVTYDEYRANGIKQRNLVVQADTLLRLGVGAGLELRLGWDGPMWQQHKAAGIKQKTDGVGDIQLGIKKSIALEDQDLSWALLAQVNLATGDDAFSQNDEIYTLGSALSYQFDSNITTGITMLYELQDGNLAWTAIPNISYPIVGKLSGFSEYVMRKAEHQPYQSVVNTGVLWSLKDNLQLDASVGYSFNRQQPDFNTSLGVAYLF